LTYIKKPSPGVGRRPSFITREKFYLENEAKQNILLKCRTVGNYFV